MADDDKKPYLEAAEIDKERYHREIGEYKEAKKNEIEQQAALDKNKNRDHHQTSTTSSSSSSKDGGKTNGEKLLTNGKDIAKEIKSGDIPIFTDEFLEHNKMIDSELRLLRKSNTDLEQQNAVLEKHVENMQNGVEKLESEMISIADNNTVLNSFLDKMKNKLASALSALALPGKYIYIIIWDLK